MQAVSQEYAIPLVDSREDFFKALMQESPAKYFISEKDYHCRKSGYTIIAQNIADTIQKILPEI